MSALRRLIWGLVAAATVFSLVACSKAQTADSAKKSDAPATSRSEALPPRGSLWLGPDDIATKLEKQHRHSSLASAAAAVKFQPKLPQALASEVATYYTTASPAPLTSDGTDNVFYALYPGGLVVNAIRWKDLSTAKEYEEWLRGGLPIGLRAVEVDVNGQPGWAWDAIDQPPEIDSSGKVVTPGVRYPVSEVHFWADDGIAYYVASENSSYKGLLEIARSIR